MDVFIEEFNRKNFPIGSSLVLCAAGKYMVHIPNMHIAEYDADPLVAVEKAKEQLELQRKKVYEDRDLVRA